MRLECLSDRRGHTSLVIVPNPVVLSHDSNIKEAAVHHIP